MKKLLLSIGSITSVVAPIAAAISCSSDDLKLPELPKPGSPGNIASVDLSTELAKFTDATSTLDETTIQAAITAGTLTTAALGFAPSSTLASGVTATFAVKTPFVAGKVVLTVTLAKAGASSVTNNTKDIAITAKPAAVVTPVAADLTSEIAKFTDVTSTLYDLALTANAAATTSIVDEAKLGITTPSTLASGLTASYAVKTPFAIDKAVITVTLTKDDGTAVTNNTKDITVTAKAFDYTTTIAAIKAAASGLSLPDGTPMGHVESVIKGTQPVITDGTVVGYKISTATDHATSATHDVKVLLSNPLTTNTDESTIINVAVDAPAAP